LQGAAVLAAALLISSPGTPHAHAAIACRTDPIVTLSNGVTVQMSNTIYDYASNVSKVAYTLHAPAGTMVTSVVYPPGTTSIPESFQFAADNNPGRYESYAVVYDANRNVTVSADTVVTDPATHTSLSQTAQDRPYQDIKIEAQLPVQDS
jgi:hypothetical protein